MAVHPTAILTGEVDLAEDVEVGPFVVIRGPVRIGSGTVVEERATIIGHTEIGRDNRICCGALIGGDPQDLSYTGHATHLKIGDRNTLREYCTVHRGVAEGAATTIGDDNLFMGLTHIGHDCCIHNNVIISNNSLLAGHVELFDRAIVSGQVAVHQFTRVGRFGMAAGLSRVSRDIPPFMIVFGESAVLGPNVVGLRRASFSSDRRAAIQRAFRVLYRSRIPFSEAVAKLKEAPETDDVKELIEFIETSKRGICMHRRAAHQISVKAGEGHE